MDNITMTEQPQAPSAPTPQTPLINVDVTDENVALNVMVSFLNVAQKRGAFDLAESSKIWECVQKFIIPNQK